MFWEKWIPKKYLIKSSVCGIEVLIGDNGLQIYGVTVKNQDDKITLGDTFSAGSVAGLPADLKKNKIPLVLCLTGQGIINRKITVPEGETLSPAEAAARFMPTLHADEFYMQLHPQEQDRAFLSIIRKTQLDEILALFTGAKYEVASLLIGPAFIANVGPVAANFNRVETAAYTIELANHAVDTLLDAKASEEGPAVMDVEGLRLTKHSLLGFCAAFTYLTHSFGNFGQDPLLRSYHDRHIQGNKLRVLAYSFISIAFIACLLNFFMFNHYFGKAREVDTELNIYQGKYEQINELLGNYEKQKDLIEQAGILNANSFSEYADRIAGTVPDEVVLVEWIFNPANERAEEDSLLNFRPNTILLRGNCNKSLIINEWLNVLKSQNFIRDINLEKFAFNNEGNQPNFEIKIISN